MPWWGWVLSAPAALLVLGLLALALYRVRYRLEWRGEWGGGLSASQEGMIEIRYGFVGFTKTWNPLEDQDWSFPNPFDFDDDAEKATAASAEAPSAEAKDPFSSKPDASREEPFFLKPGTTQAGPPPNRQRAPAGEASRKKSSRKPKKDPNRRRRAVFRFVTDPDVWKFFARYGVKCVSLVIGLFKPRAQAALGHPDPVLLGRLAGKWYAVRPFLPLGDTLLHFRFQDRHPTLWVKAEGGFSLLEVVGFGLRLLLSFPLIRFGRSAWKGWKHHELTGWRAWIYRRLQTPAKPARSRA